MKHHRPFLRRRRTDAPRRLRAGFTLIEMMVAISVSATLFTLAIRLIHQSMTLSETARGYAQAQQTAERIVRQFRSDVQESASVSLAPDDSFDDSLDDSSDVRASLTLRIEPVAGGAIHWRVERFLVTRVQQTAMGAERRERYRFPESYRAELTLLEAPRRGVLSVSRGHDQLAAAPRTQVRVEAIAGRLLRLEGRQEESP